MTILAITPDPSSIPNNVYVVAAPYAPAGPTIMGTSDTPNVVGPSGDKVFVMNEFGLGFQDGARLRATAMDAADAPNTWLEGICSAFDPATDELTITVDNYKGNTLLTYDNWNINVAGERGVAGPQGPIGPMGAQGPPGGAPVDSPQFTGDPQRLSPPPLHDNDTSIPTTQWVTTELSFYALIASPSFTGTPTAPTPAAADNSTKIATTAYVTAAVGAVTLAYAPLNSPTFTGDPKAPTPTTADNDTSIATTAFVKAQGYATLDSPVLTGDPQAPTPATADNDTSIATTAYVKANLANYQLADADLASLAAVSATGVLFYRYGDGDWRAVTMGANMGFDPATGLLSSSGGSGGGIPEAPSDGTGYFRRNITWAAAPIQSDAPNDGGYYARRSLGWSQVDSLFAPIASPTFTGDPKAPTPAIGDNDTSIATTAFVKAQAYAPLASPVFTGNPVGPTPVKADNSISLATTAHVKNVVADYAPLASPVLTGDPQAPTPAANDNDTSIATTAYVQAGRARTLLQTISPAGTPNASIDYTAWSGLGYTSFEVEVFGSPASGATTGMGIRMSTDGTTFFAGASDYQYASVVNSSANTSAAVGATSSSFVISGACLSGGTAHWVSGWFKIFDPVRAGNVKSVLYNASTYNGTNHVHNVGAGALYGSTAPILKMVVQWGTGVNWSAGSTVRVYGCK